MALVDLKSNLANYRSTFTTPSVETQAVPAVSKPSNVNKTQFTKSFVDKSKFDRPDDFILKYTGRTQFRQNFVNKSKFNLDDTPSNFSIQQIYTPSKFTFSSVVNKSKFNLDSTPSKFSIQQIYTPSKFNFNSVVNKSKFNLDSTPSKFGNDSNQSHFKGISGTQFTYPNLTGLGTRLWQPAKTTNSNIISTFPGPQNFFNDSYGSGFTNDFWNAKKGLTKKETQFKNLNYIDTVSIPTPLNSSKGPGGGWILGDTSFKAQLGNGSTNLIKSYDTLIANTYNWYTPTSDNGKKGKESKHTGFHADNKYLAKGNAFKGFLAASYNTHSPVDDVYKKFNLRDEAYNPTYMKQPFIVRGIQRKGNETPQYWGFGSRSGFDDGLIRGGVVTVADRVVADTVRIAKFMTSPKGLLWIVKQVGLGLTNAKVEAVGGTFGRQTRIHTGVTSLLSVVGAPFGLHFTRHGLPFANEISSYGNVIKTKQLPLVGNPSYSRLVDLQNEFDAGKFYSNKIIEGLSKVKIVKTKTLGSAILSGLGGPGSVYGIGFTQIRRVVDTKTDAIARAEKLGFTQTYGVEAQYASTISKGILKTSIDSDKNKRTIDDIENNKPALIGVTNTPKSIFSKANKSNFGKRQTPGAGEGNSIETNAGKVTAYPNSPDSNINNYITMAYGKIPKNSSDKTKLKGDFRNALEEDKKGFTGKPNDYIKNSLEGRYGFGNIGQVGADRTDPNKFLVPSKKFNKTDRFVLINKGDAFRGDKVTATDIASPGKGISPYQTNANDLITFYFEDGVEGTNVMPFRCTMTGFSDSFNPGWDRIDIMGRPDGAYLYTSFDRAVSFNFTVAALSRSEMIPMWRKLNYLSTYTMPDFTSNSARPSGPFMRISIGSLFRSTPGFISSLSYTVPDDTTWDIADDVDNKDAKQLPMVVDVAMSFTIVGDFRPQMMGRAYSLQDKNDWLADSVTKFKK